MGAGRTEQLARRRSTMRREPATCHRLVTEAVVTA